MAASEFAQKFSLDLLELRDKLSDPRNFAEVRTGLVNAERNLVQQPGLTAIEMAKAEKELAEAKKELAEAKKELAEAKKELAEAKLEEARRGGIEARIQTATKDHEAATEAFLRADDLATETAKAALLPAQQAAGQAAPPIAQHSVCSSDRSSFHQTHFPTCVVTGEPLIGCERAHCWPQRDPPLNLKHKQMFAKLNISMPATHTVEENCHFTKFQVAADLHKCYDRVGAWWIEVDPGKPDEATSYRVFVHPLFRENPRLRRFHNQSLQLPVTPQAKKGWPHHKLLNAFACHRRGSDVLLRFLKCHGTRFPERGQEMDDSDDSSLLDQSGPRGGHGDSDGTGGRGEPRRSSRKRDGDQGRGGGKRVDSGHATMPPPKKNKRSKRSVLSMAGIRRHRF